MSWAQMAADYEQPAEKMKTQSDAKRAIVAAGTRSDEGMASVLLGFARPEWHKQALCRGAMRDGDADWFALGDNPTGKARQQRAQEICRRCPVRQPCHDAGLEEFGVWGGVTRRVQRVRPTTGGHRNAARTS